MPDETGQDDHSQWSHAPTYERQRKPTNMRETESLTELAAQFGIENTHTDPTELDSDIVSAMEYIDENTGLLGDYNDGYVGLAEGGRIIQWFPRGRYFSAHDNLLHWIQMEADGLLIGSVGNRTHPKTGETSAYIEIHLAENWGYDDE